jgi:hypothetical protein
MASGTYFRGCASSLAGDKMRKYVLLLSMLVLLTACGAQPQPTQDVSAIVNATLTAIVQSNPQGTVATEVPQSTPQPGDSTTSPVQPSGQLVVRPTDPNATPGRDYFPPMGTVTGKLSYPSSFIPPMRVAFFNAADNSVVSYTDTGKDQGTFSVDLPEGTYYVVAYPYDASNYTPPAAGTPVFAGGYTAAVPCGLSVDCTDHSLLPVAVVAGQTVTADPGDWYAPENSFPPMPYP